MASKYRNINRPNKIYPLSPTTTRRSAESEQKSSNYHRGKKKGRTRNGKSTSVDFESSEAESTMRVLLPKIELGAKGLKIVPEFKSVKPPTPIIIPETPVKEENELPELVSEIFSAEKVSFRKTMGPKEEEMSPSKNNGRMSSVGKSRGAFNVQKGVEIFWTKHISEKSYIRWDLFEEALMVYIETHIENDPRIQNNINWKKFIFKVFEGVSDHKKNFSLWPKNYCFNTPPEYLGKHVSKEKFTDFVLNGEFLKIMVSCQEQNFNTIENIRMKQDKFQFADGTVFVGSWEKGRKEGNGILKLTSGDKYEGNFNKGLREGRGRFTGVLYEFEGNWKEDRYEGFGTMKFPDGSLYEGLWKYNRITKGTLSWSEGYTYKGKWKHNLFHGKGSLIYPNGDKHKGHWRKGHLEGKAEIKTSEGIKYRGIFQEGLLQEEGELIAHEYFYQGFFTDSIPNGRGLMKFKNGNEYEGDLKNGLKHGKGVQIFTNGDRYIGDFRVNERTGRAKIEYADGRFYEGDVFKGIEEGIGVMFFPKDHECDRYIGLFAEGKYNGRGSLWYKNGNFYDGGWLKGLESGKGIFKIGKGKYSGEFENGLFNGYGEFVIGRAFYSGDWKKGMPDGIGEALDWKGCKYSGAFIKGIPVTKHKLQKNFLDSLLLTY